MKFKPRTEEDLEINITPLIDVVFLLLIFFMVSTTFDKTSELKIDLPQSSAVPVTAPIEAVDILVDKQGRFFVNGSQVMTSHVDALIRVLTKVTKGNKDLPVVLRADAMTPHQSVVTAMDAVAKLGLTRLSIATLNSE